MHSRVYHLVDVFTARAFGGNPLAVFTDGRGIPDGVMQSIAKELNLSETTFVLPPDDAKHDFRVRIFTPKSELPMAGHPTVGTAFVLAREGMLKKSEAIFEEGVGPVPVSIGRGTNGPGFIEMRQPLPKFGPRFEDANAVAEMLSLERSAIRDLPLEVVSCGNPFFFVPIDTLASIRRIRFRSDLAERIVKETGATGVFVFTQETEMPGSQVHGRLFAPGEGILEDPATGSAAGPLGCYLSRYNLTARAGETRSVLEQGIEMGRPSFLHIRIRHTGDEIT
ncbi:MAG TPA: PhzF family phenazine biosynthesis protein, partial [Chthoniobacterales bacterium]|nr:PhzF family phenazine biosynthesis protein [Chthoniobacterales bacterium]